MPYLNVDLDYFSHRKAVRLIGLIGSQHVAVPIKLWAYVGKHHCEDGSLKGYSIQEIESILTWKGKKGALVDALATVGFLDKVDALEGVYYQVHDWLEHAGHLSALRKRAKANAKKRWNNMEGDDKSTRSERLSRAREKGTHTFQQWEALKYSFKNTCVRCMDATMPIEKDHIVPLYLDGSDGISNIQPSCAKCNSSKTSDSQDYRIAYLIKTGQAHDDEEAKRLLECILLACIGQQETPATAMLPLNPLNPLSLPSLLNPLNPLGAGAPPPNRKCAAHDQGDPCQEYAMTGSRYCASHKDFYVKLQERMKGKVGG